ncbi:MAG: GIY-YIG nuclease family protein [Candidatus Staskawiczbacteria bacterium]|nr:GIY-YIG nuclease family protein [Candidatus Staskawiczbacteria bacterium]
MAELADARDLPAGRQAQNPDTHMYYVYIIKSEKRNYNYVGITNNPERRIKEHNRGYNRITKPYKPFKIILIEKHFDRTEARKREKFLKSGYGKEYVKGIQ